MEAIVYSNLVIYTCIYLYSFYICILGTSLCKRLIKIIRKITHKKEYISKKKLFFYESCTSTESQDVTRCIYINHIYIYIIDYSILILKAKNEHNLRYCQEQKTGFGFHLSGWLAGTETHCD